MDARAIYDRLVSDGFALSIEGDRLRVAPPDRLTDALRDLIRHHRSDLFEMVQSERPVWRYLIEHADGELIEHSFSPWATRAEVSSWYPDARRIEALPDVHRDPTDEAAAA